MERSAGDDDFSRDRENDYTQLSNYSPQDSPRQGPTRRHYDERDITHDPYRDHRQGSITGDESQRVGGKNNGGGRSIAEMIERRWKGERGQNKQDEQKQGAKRRDQQQQQRQQTLQRPPLSNRPSMGPEPHRESFVERIEVASQNMLRRSSSNADALIDRLSDVLNAWSTGVDEKAYPDEKVQQMKHTDQSEESRSKKSKKTLERKEEETDSTEEIPLNDESPQQRKRAGSITSQDRRSWPSFAELFTIHPTSNQVQHQVQHQAKQHERQQGKQKDNQLQLMSPSEQQQRSNSRRLSWTERAFSFLFNRSLKKPDEWGTQPDVEVQGSDQVYDDVQGSFKLWSFSAAAVAVTTATPLLQSSSSPSSTKAIKQEIVKSDELKKRADKKEEERPAMTESVSSAPLLNTRTSESNQQPVSSAPYRRDFPQPPNIRLHNESLPTGKQPVHHAEIIPARSGSIEHWPTESYAKVARRSMTDTVGGYNEEHQGREAREEPEEEWFECDPESGRVKVPPLSVPHAPSSTTELERKSSVSLYDTVPPQQKTSTSSKSNNNSKKKRRKKNKQEKNKYHVVHHKKHPEDDQGIPEREPRFDSDFENWRMAPESNTFSRRHKGSWPDSYQIKDENKRFNDRNNMKRQSLSSEKNVWVAQADAMD